MFPSARKAISEKEQGLSTRSLWKNERIMLRSDNAVTMTGANRAYLQ